MRNIKTSIKGTVLTITADLSAEGKLSASGKNHVIASTEGNQKVEVGDKTYHVGVNIYTK